MYGRGLVFCNECVGVMIVIYSYRMFFNVN